MEELSKEDPVHYTYGNDVVIHFKKVAHTAVRYTGTIAGNLMMKHAHQGIVTSGAIHKVRVRPKLDIFDNCPPPSTHYDVIVTI